MIAYPVLITSVLSIFPTLNEMVYIFHQYSKRLTLVSKCHDNTTSATLTDTDYVMVLLDWIKASKLNISVTCAYKLEPYVHYWHDNNGVWQLNHNFCFRFFFSPRMCNNRMRGLFYCSLTKFCALATKWPAGCVDTFWAVSFSFVVFVAFFLMIGYFLVHSLSNCFPGCAHYFVGHLHHPICTHLGRTLEMKIGRF